MDSSPDLKETLSAVLSQAEELKKAGDLQFAHQEFEAAIESYTNSCKSLGPIWGFPFGEVTAIRSLANQAQCYLKLGKNEEAVVSCDTALSIPSVVNEQHLLCKIFKRRGTACEALSKHAMAINSYDWAIRFGDDTADTVRCRERVVQTISEKETGFVAIPPPPEVIEPKVISELIVLILQNKGDPEVVIPALMEKIVDKRGALDTHDEQKNNIMWAVCQAAIMRANTEGMDADDVLPVLELLIQNGSRANQRFLLNGLHRTPLQMLAVAGAPESVSLLTKSGAPLPIIDQKGWSALEVACSLDHPRHKSKNPSNHEVVSILLDAKANPKYKIPGSGMSALALAAQAGDGESVVCLLNAGAIINVRCAIGFSPLIWSMIGNGPRPFKENKAFMVLNHRINSCNVQQLQMESKEDIKCFHFSAILHELRTITKKVVPAEISAAQMDRLRGMLHNAYLQVIHRRVGLPVGPAAASADTPPPAPKVSPPLPPGTSEENEAEGETKKEIANNPHVHDTDEANKLLRICSVLISQYIPRIVTRKWTPKEDHPDRKDVLAALINASPIERCWLSTVMCATTGPQNDKSKLLDFTSPFCPGTLYKQDFGVVGCYSDFVKYIRETLAREYSPFIPSGVLLDQIAEARYLVSFDDHNGYWSKLLRMCRIKSDDVPTEEESYCQVIQFDADQGLRPESEDGALRATEEEKKAENNPSDCGKVNLLCTKERPALLLFSEPSLPVDTSSDRPSEESIIDAKLRALVKLLDVYHDSNTIFLIGQHTGPTSELYKDGLAYKCTAAIEAFLLERRYSLKNVNPTPQVEGEDELAASPSAEEKQALETQKLSEDCAILMAHWPFEINRMQVWQRPRSE